MDEIVRLLRERPIFVHVHEIPAMHCHGGVRVGHREVCIE